MKEIWAENQTRLQGPSVILLIEDTKLGGGVPVKDTNLS